MRNNLKTKEDEIWEGLYPRIFILIKKDKWAWQSAGAIFGFGGGILSVFAGIACHIATWWVSPGSAALLLKRISVVCFLLFVPLMVLGAHFLDLIEEKHFKG